MSAPWVNVRIYRVSSLTPALHAVLVKAISKICAAEIGRMHAISATESYPCLKPWLRIERMRETKTLYDT